MPGLQPRTSTEASLVAYLMHWSPQLISTASCREQVLSDALDAAYNHLKLTYLHQCLGIVLQSASWQATEAALFGMRCGFSIALMLAPSDMMLYLQIAGICMPI